MGERRWARYRRSWVVDSYSDAEVLREILLDENGEPRDGVGALEAAGGRMLYLIPAEMLEADDE